LGRQSGKNEFSILPFLFPHYSTIPLFHSSIIPTLMDS